VTASSTLVEPAHYSRPEYDLTLGPEVADLCELVGFGPDPEQRMLLDDVFAVGADRKSAAFEVCVKCARQNLKTGLFKQCALGWLWLCDVPLVIWSAHEFSTAQEAHRDVAALIDGSALLSRRVKRVYNGNGDERVELMSGARLLFKARTKTGGRGLSGHKVILDEAFALKAAHMGALLPTLSVMPDPQVLYGSSAALSDSEILRRLTARGRAGHSRRLVFCEWCAPRGGCEREGCTHEVGVEGCALDRVENRRAANPLLGRTRANGTGLTYEYVDAERQALPPGEFARERLGWDDEPGAADAFGAGRWEGCAGDPPPASLPVSGLGVAVSYDLSHAAVVAGAKDGDLLHVMPLHHGPGTGWVAGRAAELQRLHDVDVAVDAGGPAADLIPDLEKAGVRVRRLGTAQVLDACAGIYKRVAQGSLRHGSYPELDAAAGAAVKRAVGDRWAWGRKQSTADISALEAATLAGWLAEQARTGPNIW
jgi:hypothetical protein